VTTPCLKEAILVSSLYLCKFNLYLHENLNLSSCRPGQRSDFERKGLSKGFYLHNLEAIGFSKGFLKKKMKQRDFQRDFGEILCC
jgi:hypothetical protein